MGFRGQAILKNIVEIEGLRVVAMATNFGTKIAITGFVRTTATRQLVMKASLCGRLTKCRYCRYLAHRADVAMVTIFGFLYMGCTLTPPGEYD